MFNKLTGIFMILTVLFGNGKFYSQNSSSELPKHNEIEPKYTWNLEDIYKSTEDWQKDFNRVKDNISKYKEFKGKVGNSAKDLLSVLMFDENIDIKIGKLALYASLAHDLDLGNQEYQVLYNKINDLSSLASSESAFIIPEILQIPEERLNQFINEEKDLAIYRHFFDNLLRSKKHILSPAEERILALAQPLHEVPYNTFSLLKNVEVQFPKIKDESGKDEIQISDGRYYAAMYSTNREYRERAYKAYYVPFMEYKNTFNSLLNGAIKGNIFNAKARGYSSALEAALSPNNIPVEVYTNLINAVNAHLNVLHRWAKLKKKLLKYKELHPYDTYVTLFPEAKNEYSYEEGKNLVLNALKPLGEDYLKNLRYAFDNRWIDVYETKGKRSGAYSSDRGYGVHPYVLLNWNNQLNDVFTLAHEMGHNMHSHYSGTNQPYIYADYSIFVAEVASTMNEALLLDYLIENAKSKNEKLALIEKNLDNITFTFFRQTRFAEFEKIMHEKTENGEALTPDSLCKIYGELYQKYWGDEMIVDKEETYTWARIPHFYYNFYVYQYATSFAASQALEAKVKKEGEKAVEKYLNFLKSGSSDYPIEVLKKAGVDMTKPDAIISVINKMNKLLDEMEKELSE